MITQNLQPRFFNEDNALKRKVMSDSDQQKLPQQLYIHLKRQVDIRPHIVHFYA